MQLFYSLKTRLTPLFLVVCLTVSLFPSAIVRADANQLVITPTPVQMNVGQEQTFSVKAYIDASSSPPQTATGTVTYPANQILAKNLTVSGGWSGTPTINQAQGTISFSMSRNSSSTGFSTVFTVTLRATAAGTAVVGFSGDSRVNGTTTAYKSAVISIISPSPAPSPSSTPKPSTTPKPSVTPVPIVSTTPTPPPDVEPEVSPDPLGVVDGVTIKPLYNSATITWTVNAPNPTSTLDYGPSVSSLDKRAAIAKNPDGTFSTTINNLEPGKRYYFSIDGSGDGGKNGTYSSTVVANGFPVTITVTENDIAVKGAQVKVGTKTYSTSSNGKVSFGLAEGNYRVTVTTETASQTFDLAVAKKTIPSDGSAPESQSFTYKLTSSPLTQGPGSGSTLLAFGAAIVGGTIILAFGFLGFMAYRRKKFESGSSSSQQTSTVIIDDGYDWHQETSKPPAPPAVPSSPEAAMPRRHNNSVHIDEEEPLDMFEQSKQMKP